MLFLQKSYHEVTLQDILDTTGMSKGSFYHYFRSKEKVFEEVVGRFFFEASHAGYESFSTESLWAFCEDYIKMVAGRVRHYNAQTGDTTGILRANQYLMVFDALKMFPEFRENQRRMQEREQQAWTDIIIKARRNKEISTVIDDHQLAKLFIHLNYGIGASHVLRSQIEDLTRELEDQFRAFYETLKTHN